MSNSTANRTYKCPNCGADLRFDPGSGKIICDYCDAVFSPEDYNPETGEWNDYDKRFTKDTVENSKGGFWNNTQDDDDNLETMNEFYCKSCGATLYSTDVTVATFCSYCGSSQVLESRIVKEKKPDYIIPFKVSKDACEKSYKKLLRRSLFAPSEMLKDTEVEKFRGIYMPYWVYELEHKDPVAMVGSTSSRRGDYIIERRYAVTTNTDASYKGVSFDSSSGFADHLSEGIAPFEAKETLHYNPAYLSGFYADAGDVEASIYRDDAERIVAADVAKKVHQSSMEYARTGISQADIQKKFSFRSQSKKALFPVWFLSIRNKKGDRVSYAVVNGQTGKIAADIPVDFKKYLLGSLILSIPIFLILAFIPTITPGAMLFLSIILSTIALFVADNYLNKVYAAQNGLSDQGVMATKSKEEKQKFVKNQEDVKKKKSALKGGLLGVGIVIAILLFVFLMILDEAGVLGGSGETGFGVLMFIGSAIFMSVKSIINKAKTKKELKNGEQVKYRMPFKEKIFVLVKFFAAILVSVIMLISRPIQDVFYYVASLLSMAAIGWGFFDIIHAYNMLTTRKLPQFEVRGGDMDAPV